MRGGGRARGGFAVGLSAAGVGARLREERERREPPLRLLARVLVRGDAEPERCKAALRLQMEVPLQIQVGRSPRQRRNEDLGLSGASGNEYDEESRSGPRHQSRRDRELLLDGATP